MSKANSTNPQAQTQANTMQISATHKWRWPLFGWSRSSDASGQWRAQQKRHILEADKQTRERLAFGASLLVIFMLTRAGQTRCQSAPDRSSIVRRPPLAHLQQLASSQQRLLMMASGGGGGRTTAADIPNSLPPASSGQTLAADLVGLNLRRFETGHQHPSGHADLSSKSGASNRADDSLESQLASIPERLLGRLPDEMAKQLVESLSEDASLALRAAPGGLLSAAATGGRSEEDPDEASIERLTKSCLRVQASSQTAEQLNVTFQLFTRRNLREPFVMRPGVTRAELLANPSSPFDARHPIKWITHGFHTNLDKSQWMLGAKEKILAHEEANVILTDWRRGASPALAFYPRAAANAHIVAKMIVKILRRLRHDIDTGSVHLIGHSLGAHIMGFVGSAFTEEYLQLEQARQAGGFSSTLGTNGSTVPLMATGAQLIGRITACDPALPCFGPSSSGPGGRLRQTLELQRLQQQQQQQQQAALAADNWLTPTMWTHLRPDSALLVEVLHSNPGVMGYAEPLGDYDFYPNGSDRQPGCSGGGGGGAQHSGHSKRAKLPGPIEHFIKPIRDFFTTYTCSHHRSVEYMVESMYYRMREQELDTNARLSANERSLGECQMVGYKCASYAAFKRGHCFRCRSDQDCRSFGLTRAEVITGHQISRGTIPLSKFAPPLEGAKTLASQFASQLGELDGGRRRRALPTTNYQELQVREYKPVARNEYFFDTKPALDGRGQFCLHHYHFLVKYHLFRLASDQLSVARLRLIGARADMALLDSTSQFNRFTRHAYTMLQTWPDYLGPLETLLVFVSDSHELRANFRPQQVEYIEVSYLSHLDAGVRALGSARLCRAPGANDGALGSTIDAQLAHLLGMTTPVEPSTVVSVFVRCNGHLVGRKKRRLHKRRRRRRK